MYDNSQNDYQQQVAINFEGEDNLSKVVDKISERISSMQTKVMAANLGLAGMKKVTGDNVTALEKFGKQLAATDKILMKVFNLATFAKIGAVLYDGIKNATRELSGFSTGVKAFVASGYTTQIIDDFGKVQDAILGSKDAVDQFSLQALTAYNRYKKAQTEVEVLFSKGNEFVGDLSKNIQNLVNNDLKNAVSSIDALGAAYQAASASFTEAGENTAVMTAGLKLAKAGGADTGATMKVLTQTIRAYNMSATDSNKVAAVLNKTIQLGITTMPELANGFAQSAVTANAAKVKLEELAAAVAALTLQGFDTPAALTGLESLFRNIINKTPQAEAALRSLRDEAGKPIRFDIAEIKTKGFAKALDDLNKAAKGNAEVLATITGDATAFNTFLALAANNAQQLKDNLDETKNGMFAITKTGKIARETLDEVFGIKVNSQAEKFDAIINRITEQFIQFGEQVAPFFQVGVDVLEKTVSVLSSISPEMKKIIAQWLIFQMGAGQVTNAVGQLVGAATQALLVFQGWRIFTSLFNGTLIKQVEVLGGLIKTNAGLAPILKQIIGIDQSHLLVQEKLNAVVETRKGLVDKLIKGEGSRLDTLKELFNFDKEYELAVNKTNFTLEDRATILDKQIEKQGSVVKATKALQEAEQKRDEAAKAIAPTYDKLNAIYEREIEIKKRLAVLGKELVDANDNGDKKTSGLISQEALQLQKEQNQLQKEGITLQDQLKEQSTELANLDKANLEVINAENKLTDARSKAKDNLRALTEKQIEAQSLENKATKLQSQANKAQIVAEKLRAKAKTDSANSSFLLAKAEWYENKAKEFSTLSTTTNTAAITANAQARKLKIAATIAEGVADGSLLKVQTALGVSYIANTALSRLLFTQIKLGIPAMTGLSGATATFGTIANTVFTTVTATATAAFTAIQAQLNALYLKLAPFALAFAPIVAALTLIAAVGYEQFAGTTAQVRKLNEGLKDANKEYAIGVKKTLEKLETDKKITSEQKNTLLQQEKINELLDEQPNKIQGAWDSIFSNIGKGFNAIGKFFKNNATLFTLGFNKLWANWRYDQVISTFAEIETQIEKTSIATLKFAEVNSKLKQGFTDIEEVNKKIREGKALEPDDITKLKNNAEKELKLVDQKIALNDKQLESLKEKLKDYEALSDQEKENAAEQDKQLDRERDVLEAQNENLKKQRQNYADNNKALEEYVTQRNILLKRLEESNPKPNKDKDFQDADFEGQVGDRVNALQVRMKRSFRQSNEDLQEYSKKVEATLNGTNSYVDKAGNQVKLDVSQLGQYVQDFDKKVETTVAGIGQLYEGNYISAKEANEKLQAVLNQNIEGTKTKIKERLSTEQLQAYYSQVIEYSKNASKKQIDLLGKDAEIQQQLITSGIRSQLDGSKEIRKIQQEQTKAQIDDLEKTLQLQLDIAPALKQELEKQLQLLKAQLNAADKDDQRKLIDERFQQQQVALDKEVAAFKLSRAKFISTEEESVVKLEQLQKQQLIQQQSRLQEQLKLVGNDKEQRIKLETEILNVQLQYQQLVTGSLQREFDKRNKQLSNDVERHKLEYDKLIRTLSSTTDSLQEELKIIEARNKAIVAANQYELSRLQNQLRVTADIEKRADIEVELVELKNKNSEVALAQEAKSLQYQQKLIDLGFQRQQLELDISKLQNESQRKLLELELKRAIQQKQSKEEIEILQTKLDINNEETKSLESKGILQQEAKRNQIEINKLDKQSLEYKQALTRSGGALDTEIAKQNRVLATYEKQAQQAKVSAELAEISANKQLTQSNLIQKSYDNRITLAQKLLEIEQSQQDNTQRMYKALQDLATTDYQKQQYAKEAAKQELQNLDRKQEIEKQLLEMQIISNKLAMKRLVIEQQVAEKRLAAELKVQEAETRRTLADKTKTDDEKEASLAQLDAKEYAYQAKKDERPLIQQQVALNDYDNNVKRYQLERNQKNERRDKELAYVKTTFGMGDDMALKRRIKNELRNGDDIPLPTPPDLNARNSETPTFENYQDKLTLQDKLEAFKKKYNVKDVFEDKKSKPVAPKLSYDTATRNNIVPLTNNTNTTSSDKQIVINFTNTNDVTIEGNANASEVSKGVKDANDDAIKKLYDVFRKTNVELGNK